MAVMGKLLKNKRAGDEGLAWNAPNLGGEDTLELSSPDFVHEAPIPTLHMRQASGRPGPLTGPDLGAGCPPGRSSCCW